MLRILVLLGVVATVVAPGEGDDVDIGSGECMLPCKPDKGEKGFAGIRGEQGERGIKGQKGREGKYPSHFHWHISKGHPGPEGPQGNNGVPGENGSKGEKGQKGFRGESATPGEKGETGGPGSSGVFGARGDAGSPGESGDDGEPGEKGDSGIGGLVGAKGAIGPVGAQGENGVAGKAGEQGSKGLLGSSGPEGDKGDTGEPGFSGSDTLGNIAAVGEKGSKGFKGAKGEKGAKGDVGESGDAGDPGSNLRTESNVFNFVECTPANEGEMFYDNVTAEITFCDGEQWKCAGGNICCEERVYYVTRQSASLSERRNATDVLLIVDDSGSMSTEQDWIADASFALDRQLQRIGIGRGVKKNRFYVVIFGLVRHDVPDWTQHRVRIIRNGTSFTAGEVKEAEKFFEKTGNAEDGYEALEKALAMEELRSDDPEVALNIALITDEARDPCSKPLGEDPPGSQRNRTQILKLLNDKNAKLNLLANINLNSSDVENVIAVDYRGFVFGERNITVRSKQFQNVGFEPTYTACKSFLDYGYLAMETEGAIWNLNLVDRTAVDEELRQTFTEDVARIKVEEVSAVLKCYRCDITCNENGTEKEVCVEDDDRDYCFCREGQPEENCVRKTDPKTSLPSFADMYKYCTSAGFPAVYRGWFDESWPDNEDGKCFPPQS